MPAFINPSSLNWFHDEWIPKQNGHLYLMTIISTARLVPYHFIEVTEINFGDWVPVDQRLTRHPIFKLLSNL